MIKWERLSACALACALAVGTALPLASCTVGTGGEDGDAAQEQSEPAAADAAEEGEPAADGAEQTEQPADTAPVAEEAVWVVTSEHSTYTYEDSSSTTTITYERDEHGNLVRMVDDLGDTSYEDVYTVDEDGYTTAITSNYGEGDPSTVTYTIEKDEAGRMVRQTGDDGSTTTFAFDEAGNMVQRVMSASYTTEDEEGNPTEGSYTHTQNYRADGLLESMRMERDGVVQETKRTYGDDASGRPVTMTSTMQTLDENGEVVEGSESTYTQSYEYDDNGNVVKVTTEGEDYQEEITFEYAQVSDPSLGARIDAHVKLY